MTYEALRDSISTGGIDDSLRSGLAVPESRIPAERERYTAALAAFGELYGTEGEISLYSVGGRSEISGNHTDHNHGRVIAASVNLDILAFARPTDDGVVCVKSAGFPEDVVAPAAIDAPDEALYFTSASIIAGMQKAFLNAGYKVGGFRAYTTSNVLKGSGVSSSAAFEVMIGNILNHLYNDGRVPNVEIAKMAQFAENRYFGKPCGLMDQTACAVGGFITIDFADPTAPVIEKMDFDLTAAGYSLCIVNTGGNHADLNEDYASVPAEMKAVRSARDHRGRRPCEHPHTARKGRRPCHYARPPLLQRKPAGGGTGRSAPGGRHRGVQGGRYGKRQFELQVSPERLHEQEHRGAGAVSGTLPDRGFPCRNRSGIARPRRRLCGNDPGVCPRARYGGIRGKDECRIRPGRVPHSLRPSARRVPDPVIE